MWHASVSAWQDRGLSLDLPREVEREAVRCLTGVGSPDGEWWFYSERRVGHLRVPLTAAEGGALPPWDDGRVDDAGEAGPWRDRSTL